MAREALKLTVKGRVQGVGFRWWAVDRARALGVEGWVRTRADGSVEILALGSGNAIAALAAACAEGPRSAHVTGVEQAAASDDGSTDFNERATL